MSWTSELREGAIGQWFRERLPEVASVGRDVEAQVDNARSVLPPRGRSGAEHAARVGAAFGQRLAFFVEHCPPYFALLGAHRAGAVPWHDLDRLCADFDTHRVDIEQDRREPRGLLDRPSPAGWLDLRPHYEKRRTSSRGTCGDVVSDFVARTAAFLAQHAPPGQLAGSEAAERVVLRACVVFADWEDAYRSGSRRLAASADPARLGLGDSRELLSRVDDEMVDELLALSTLAHRAGGLDQLRRRAGWPTAGSALGHAAPVFAPDFADGDLLIAPRTSMDDNLLVDVKSVRNPHDRDRLRSWLHQLIGYAWMDHYATGLGTGDWRIRRVGLFFARHGVLVEWSLPQLVDSMVGGAVAYDELAREFFDVLRDGLATKGLHVTA